MSVDFTKKECQCKSNKKLFGLCDDQPHLSNPAYIDEINGSKWIAVVINEYKFEVVFTAIDNCIDIKKEDGRRAKRCDGVLSYGNTIIFVELKERGALGNQWVTDAEKQLKVTLAYFERENIAKTFHHKKAYISNSHHPKFKVSQTRRMNQFLEDTGYILRIEKRIYL